MPGVIFVFCVCMQLVQVIINTTHLEQSCHYLEEFISNITNVPPDTVNATKLYGTSTFKVYAFFYLQSTLFWPFLLSLVMQRPLSAPISCRMLVMRPRQRFTPVWMPRSTSSCSWLIMIGWLQCQEAGLSKPATTWLTWLLFWRAPSACSPTYLLVHTDLDTHSCHSSDQIICLHVTE